MGVSSGVRFIPAAGIRWLMRHLACILLALLIPVLAGGVSARRSAAVAGSAFPSEDTADDERTLQDNQDPAGAQALVALRRPVTPPATASRFFRLRVPAARAPLPGPVRTAARLSTSPTPLRC